MDEDPFPRGVKPLNIFKSPSNHYCSDNLITEVKPGQLISTSHLQHEQVTALSPSLVFSTSLKVELEKFLENLQDHNTGLGWPAQGLFFQRYAAFTHSVEMSNSHLLPLLCARY